MMKRKVIIAVCCAVMLCVLTGCQLAREDAVADVGEDRLVGVFVTTEYLDLFDFEGYLNDNIGDMSGGEITVDGNAEKYQGRLYATVAITTLTNEETGETVETEEYVFESVEGFPYFCVILDGVYTSKSDEAISEGHISIASGDLQSSVTLEGTIYVSPSGAMRSYYFNPVYQSDDGRVYAVTGSGLSSQSMDSEGIGMTQTLDAEHVTTINGEIKVDSISVTVTVNVMLLPEKIVILQMDADNKLLARTEYTPGKLPESFKPERDAEYIIVETYKKDAAGSVTVARSIYGRNDETIESFSARADGVCVKHTTQIEWSE